MLSQTTREIKKTVWLENGVSYQVLTTRAFYDIATVLSVKKGMVSFQYMKIVPIFGKKKKFKVQVLVGYKAAPVIDIIPLGAIIKLRRYQS